MRLPWSRKTEQETQPHPESAPSQVAESDSQKPAANRWYWGSNANCEKCGYSFFESCMPPFEFHRMTGDISCVCPGCGHAWTATAGA